MTDSATVYIVDDDPEVLRSMRYLVEAVSLPVVACGSAEEFLGAYDADRPGCLVLDVRMPGGMDGLDLQRALAERGTTLPIIVLTAFADVPMAISAMKAGAVEFLQKPCRDQVLLERIHEAIARDLRHRRRLRRRVGERERLAVLTARERQVFDRVVEGETTRQVAEALCISPKTVDIHRANMKKKLEVESIAELVRIAMQAREVEEE